MKQKTEAIRKCPLLHQLICCSILTLNRRCPAFAAGKLRDRIYFYMLNYVFIKSIFQTAHYHAVLFDADILRPDSQATTSISYFLICSVIFFTLG